MIPYGDLDITTLPPVDQADPTRTVQGEDGGTLHTLAVDAQGRLIMLPYGWDGTAYRKLRVDEEGRMVAVMKGAADVKWGLRGWWKFVAAEGATIKDYSGYENDGIAYSGVAEEATYKDGIIGQCIDLDGVDDYVNLGDGVILSDIMTVEFWGFFNDLTATQHIITNTDTDAKNYFLIVVDVTRFYYGWRFDDAGVNQRFSFAHGGILTPNTWFHIVLVVNTVTGEHKVYVNNNVVHSASAIYSIGVIETPLYIGAHAGPFLDGQIDELRVYGRALSADEVAWRYANTNPLVGKPTRMIAVDGEGRMMVNVNDLPYKNTVMLMDYVNDHAAGVVKIEFDPVPTGKLWVITNVICRCMLDDNGATSLYIRRGAKYHMIGEVMRTMLYHTLNFNSHAYLKAGDIIACWFSAVDLNKSCEVYINGYELDAP